MNTPPSRMADATEAAVRSEAERYFAMRAARSVPGRAREILSRLGTDGPPEPNDELPPDLAERLAARRSRRRG